MSSAIVMSGAVAKGPFEAGALQVLVERGVEIRAILGASAGALSAAVMAMGVRSGLEQMAADDLVKLWVEKAGLRSFLSFNVVRLLRGLGILTMDAGISIVDETLQKYVGKGKNPVSLTLMQCALTAQRPGAELATHEVPARFRDDELDGSGMVKRIAQFACASAAFPIVFQPVELDGLGYCIDGGTTNNTPIKWAIKDPTVDSVYVITPEVDLSRYKGQGGITLVNRVSDILVNEQRNRDIKAAMEVNADLVALEELKLDEKTLLSVKEAIGYKDVRRLRIIQISNPTPLPGNSFSGFVDRALREHYVELGRQAATKALSN